MSKLTKPCLQALEEVILCLPLAKRRAMRPQLTLLRAEFPTLPDFMEDRRGQRAGEKIAHTFAEKRLADRSWALEGDRYGLFAYATLGEAARVMGVTEGSLRVRTSGRSAAARERVLTPGTEPELVTCRRVPKDDRQDMPTEAPRHLLLLLERLKSRDLGRRL